MKGEFHLVYLIFIIVGILIFAFGLLAAYTINESIIEQVEDDDIINSTYLKQGRYAMEVFNSGFIFIVVGLIMALVIGAFMIQTHPVFAVASILILMFVIILGAVFSNVFYEYSTSSQMTEAASSFSSMSMVFQNLPLIVLVAGVLIMVALYGKGGSA